MSSATPPRPAWTPLVVAGLCSTLVVGAISGASDLWQLRVVHAPIPLDHTRAHALAQLFGFLLMVTMGLSLHLAPRFLGAAPPDRRWVKQVAWLCVGGLVLAVLGRFGRLVPGSTGLGLLGAIALTVGVGRWALLIFGMRLGGAPAMDWQPAFLVTGAAWWLLGALLFLGWTFGHVGGGPLAQLSLGPVWAVGLFGATGSWIFGIMLRAGVCVLRVERPSEGRQAVLFAGWQAAAVAQLVGAFFPEVMREAAAVSAVGALAALVALRPWPGALASLPDEPFLRRMVQLGLVALAGWAGLQAVVALAPTPPALLSDAARHAYTMGFLSLLIFGFGGRMVPGFSGRSLAAPAAYTSGALLLLAGLVARFAQLVPGRLGSSAAGSSALLSVAGVSTLTACLLVTLLARRPAPTPLGVTLKVSL